MKYRIIEGVLSRQMKAGERWEPLDTNETNRLLDEMAAIFNVPHVSDMIPYRSNASGITYFPKPIDHHQV